MTKNEVAELLGLIASVHRTFQITPEIVDGWAILLAKDDAASTRGAVVRLLRTSKFPPTVAEIVQDAAEARLGLPDPEAILDEIRREIREVGPYQTPHLSPIAAAVVSTLGWQNLCDSEEPGVINAQITRTAATYRKRAIEAGNLFAAGLQAATPCLPVERETGPTRLGVGVADVLRGLPS